MGKNRETYRIRTAVGNDAPPSVNVNLSQTFDTVDVLSLEISQKNFYKMPAAGYGVVVGRVLANGGFGIPNAKVSVFIPYDRNSLVEDNGVLYHYTSTMSKDGEGVRYNLLPRHLDEECHQDVGSMYGKEYMLDNDGLIQVFEKYYKYTAVTNAGGDYFIYGVPVGTQTVHVDLDLSDIGVLSQRPRDMMYKGYNADMFDSPNKFKKSKNLNNLPQIFSQDSVVTVYPFWGDTTVDETNGVITRCDINIDYTFEPTCVFMGSMVSDTGDRAISQRCVPDDEIGKMSELVAGEGKIEMIRKTFDGKVEEFAIKSNNLIDGDGVWCYQIPMNLDYVMTDEFGNMVPTDDPSKGIPTRARVRFRISMNETETDETARKRARFLVPNNPKLNDDYPHFKKTHEADYEFGTFTKEESYRDLFWNKVYTVKSYIPRLQKAKAMRRRVHTGIKNVNHSGGHNPFPFNNLFVRLTFTYRFLCTLMTLLCLLVYSINTVLGFIGWIFYELASVMLYIDSNPLFKLGVILNPVLWPVAVFDIFDGGCGYTHMAKILLEACEKMVIKLENFCDDGNFTTPTYIPTGSDLWRKLMTDSTYSYTVDDCGDSYDFPSTSADNYDFNLRRLFNCVENQLAQDQECTSFNFNNDWINGVLYAPLWYRKVRSKKRIFFNLIPLSAKDKWCDGTSSKFADGLSLCQTCAQKKEIDGKKSIKPLPQGEINGGTLITVRNQLSEANCYGYKCHKKTVSFINLSKGLIIPIETLRGDTVYYYKSVEYDNTYLKSQYDANGKGDVKMLFATDIVLLGSLNDCDAEGVPQFFKKLEGTTYNMPPDLVLMDYDSDETKIKFEDRAVDSDSANNMNGEMHFGDEGLADQEEDIDVSNSVNPDSIFTDKTGADWGNYGKDQVTGRFIEDFYNEIDGLTGKEYIYPTKAEKPDYGGLFYGLTCWSAYTKPKSCVNLSRVCEYGVSLDETQENPVYNVEELNKDGEWPYEHMAPDGFISYDELYDRDGRAMFATMNGNNLRTKINPKNGFPVYDFMYLYPENFDGTLRHIMAYQAAYRLPSPQNNNYVAEESSEAYLRFRYGRNREDELIQYYDSIRKNSLYSYPYSLNNGRFPKYENSFYFYFGLNPGNTAIDKFRTRYYSECRDTDGEHPVLTVEFDANDWCSEVTNNGHFQPGNGWLKIDATYMDAPYDVYIDNMSGDTTYDVHIEHVDEPRIYFSVKPKNGSGDDTENDFESDGFVQMKGEDGTPYALLNGNYRLTIVDANGEEVRQYIDFTKPSIRATVNRNAFRVKNEELGEYVSGGDVLNNTARLGGNTGENMSDRTPIGGFIKVSDISQDGSQLVDYRIEVEPLFETGNTGVVIVPASMGGADRGGNRDNVEPETTTSYNGSWMEVHQAGSPELTPPAVINYDHTLMNQCFENIPPYCPYGYDCPQYPDTPIGDDSEYKTEDGRYEFRFGVPLGGKKYRVTVTMICDKDGRYYPTRNKINTTVTVPEPIPFKMIINGVDYEIIKNFKPGWHFENGEVFPENYQPDEYFTDNFHGWMDIDNIDGLELLDLLTEETENDGDFESYIRDTEDKLTNNYEQAGTPYNWVGEYVFNPSEALTTIDRFDVVPNERQSGVAFILVRVDENSDDYVFYVWNDELNEGAGGYEPFLVDGHTVNQITTELYYDYSDLDTKNDYIIKLNEVTERRMQFVESMKQAFVMTSTETSYSLDVDSLTYERPVNTRIYYSPDTDSGTSTEYVELDNGLVENSLSGINVSTLTGVVLYEGAFAYHSADLSLQTLGNYSFTPIDATNYKKPYLVGIENGIKETLPVAIGENENNNDGLSGDIQVVSQDMFGVHMLEKRLKVVYNLWSPIYNVPYYNETTGTIPQGMATKIFLRGIFAGFVCGGDVNYIYTDLINSLYPETVFATQNISGNTSDENVKIVTLTTDENGNVLESSIPVVRLMYSDIVDNSNYIDYEFADGSQSDYNDNILNSMIETAFEFTDNDGTVNHFTIFGDNNIFRITDMKNNEVVIPLYDEVTPPTVTYFDISDFNYGYRVDARFNEGWCYTFYDGKDNPIYQKKVEMHNLTNDGKKCLVFENPYLKGLPSPNEEVYYGRMNFNDRHFNFDENNEVNNYNCYVNLNGNSTLLYSYNINGNVFERTNNVITYGNYRIYPITTVYTVRISKDGQRRTVSKTYDLTPLEFCVYLDYDLDPMEISTGLTRINHKLIMALNIGLIKQNSNGFSTLEKGFYYLRKYTFTLDFMENDESFKHYIVNGGYTSTYHDQLNNSIMYAKIELENFQQQYPVVMIQDLMNRIKNNKAFLTDVTGLVREMIQFDTTNDFKHCFGLFNTWTIVDS